MQLLIINCFCCFRPISTSSVATSVQKDDDNSEKSSASSGLGSLPKKKSLLQNNGEIRENREAKV